MLILIITLEGNILKGHVYDINNNFGSISNATINNIFYNVVNNANGKL